MTNGETVTLTVIEKICNRGIWLNEGQVKKDGKVKDVIEEYLKACG